MDYYVTDYAATSATPEMTTATIIYLVFAIIASLFMIVTLWKIFTKAGKPGIASIIPIYNIVTMYKIAGLPGWYFLLMFVPIVNIYAMIILYVKLAKAFGKTTGFAVGMMFLPIIFFPILAFGKNEYNLNGTQTETNEENVPTQPVTEATNNVDNSYMANASFSQQTEPTPAYEAKPLFTQPVVENNQQPIQTTPVAEPQISVQPMFNEPVAQTAPVVEPQIPIQPMFNEPVVQSTPVAEPQIPVQPMFNEPIAQPVVESTNVETPELEVFGSEETPTVTINPAVVQDLEQGFKKCPNCGAKVADHLTTCFMCGKNI